MTARLAWLMVAAVAIWALFGGAAFVGATHTTPLPLTLVEADKECQDAFGPGYTGWKIDEIDDLHAGPYTFSNADGSVTGSITFTGGDGGQPTGYTNLVISPAPDEIIVKQPQERGGISHITFCYAPVTATTTPTVPPTTTPTVPPTTTPTVPPTVSPTPTPSETVGPATPTPTPVVTATPSETVAGATPTPTSAVTPPSTSTETPVGGPTQSGLLLVLVLLGVGTTGLLVFSPRRFRNR
jgi:hypothetical protein